MNRRRLSYLLAALGAIAFIWAFLLAHGSGHQTVQGWKPNPREPDGRGEETSVRVECASPASGPRPHGVGEPDADAVAEDNGWELSQRLVDYTDGSDDFQTIGAAGLDASVVLRFQSKVAVPEPGSLGLVAVAGLGLLARRRHRK